MGEGSHSKNVLLRELRTTMSLNFRSLRKSSQSGTAAEKDFSLKDAKLAKKDPLCFSEAWRLCAPSMLLRTCFARGTPIFDCGLAALGRFIVESMIGLSSGGLGAVRRSL